MKRLLAVLLPVTLALGCVGASTQSSVYAKEVKNEDVTFELPEETFPEDISEKELKAITKDLGYKDIDVNLDGSATVTVTAKRAKEIAKETMEGLKETAQAIVDDETNPITDIGWNSKSFEYFEITTKSKKMTKAENELVEQIAAMIERVHQCKKIGNYEYEIVVFNGDTNEVLSSTGSQVSSSSSSFSFNF